jgi:hypothetical protein
MMEIIRIIALIGLAWWFIYALGCIATALQGINATLSEIHRVQKEEQGYRLIREEKEGIYGE